ncbi:MAG: AraC family transcriptional regulator [Planctomycetota bacterium]
MPPVETIHLAPILAPGEVFHFATVTEASLPCRQHRHDFVELFWVESGTGVEQGLDGQRPLGRGDFGLVVEDHVHGFRSTDGLVFHNVALSRESLTDLTERYAGDFDNPFDRSPDERRGRLPSDLQAAIGPIGAAMRAGRRDAATLDAFLLWWCVSTAKGGAAFDRGSADSVPAWLSEAIHSPALVDEGVPGLVAACGYRREYVARACRKHLGKTPRQIVLETRLTTAARLLEQTDHSVLEIGFASGFANAGHFHQCFRAAYGTTPRKYRLRVRGVIPSLKA